MADTAAIREYGAHHRTPTSLVQHVDAQVRPSQPAEQVRGSWRGV